MANRPIFIDELLWDAGTGVDAAAAADSRLPTLPTEEAWVQYLLVPAGSPPFPAPLPPNGAASGVVQRILIDLVPGIPGDFTRLVRAPLLDQTPVPAPPVFSPASFRHIPGSWTRDGFYRPRLSSAQGGEIDPSLWTISRTVEIVNMPGGLPAGHGGVLTLDYYRYVGATGGGGGGGGLTFGDSTGPGLSVLDQASVAATSIVFRKMQAGLGIGIAVGNETSPYGDEMLTFTNTGVRSLTSAAVIGDAVALLNGGTANEPLLRTLTPGSGIEFDTTASGNITINATGDVGITGVVGSSIAGAQSLVASSTAGGNAVLRDLRGGTNITFDTTTAGQIIINGPATTTVAQGSGGILVTGTAPSFTVSNTLDGANVGTAGAGTAGVFAQKTGSNLEFRRIVQGTGGITVAEDGNTITISAIGTVGIAAVTGSGVAGAQSLVASSTAGGNAVLRDLRGGTNITFDTTTAGQILINGPATTTVTQGSGGILVTGTAPSFTVSNTLDGANVGTAGAGTAGVFSQKNGSNLEFRRIVQGTGGISVAEDGNTITISATGTVGIAAVTGSGVAGAQSLVASSTAGGNAVLRDLRGGTNITFDTTTAGQILINGPAATVVLPGTGINVTGSAPNFTVTNAGVRTLISPAVTDPANAVSILYNDTDTNDIRLRRLASGPGLTITEETATAPNTERILRFALSGSGSVTSVDQAPGNTNLLITPTTGAVRVSLSNSIRGLPAGTTFSINDGAGTSATNIGTGNTTGIVTIGNLTPTSSTVIEGTTVALISPTANINVSGNRTTNINTTNGTLNLGSTGGTAVNIAGAVGINVNAGVNVTNIGTGFTTGLVTIGNTGVSASTAILGRALSINDSAGVSTTNIGTGTTTGNVSIGNTATGTLAISGNITNINTNATTPGTVNLGRFDAVVANRTTVNIAGLVNINGDVSGASQTSINASGSTGNVTIGSQSSTPAITMYATTMAINEGVTSTYTGATNIGTGTTTGMVTIGGHTAAKSQSVTIRAGQTSGAVDINVGTAAATTNIGTGTTTGLVTIGDNSATKTQSVAIRGGTTGSVDINVGSIASTDTTTNIGTGTTRGNISIGNSTAGSNQAVTILSGPNGSININNTGIATTNIGGGSNTTNIGSSSASVAILGAVSINNASSSATNIGTGNSAGLVTIGGGDVNSQEIIIRGGNNATTAGRVSINHDAATAVTRLGTGTGAGAVSVGRVGGTLDLLGSTTSINHDAATAATRIGTGTTTGAVTIGGGTTTQTVAIRGGAATGGGVGINVGAGAATTNIGTGATTGKITIGHPTADLELAAGTVTGFITALTNGGGIAVSAASTTGSIQLTNNGVRALEAPAVTTPAGSVSPLYGGDANFPLLRRLISGPGITIAEEDAMNPVSGRLLRFSVNAAGVVTSVTAGANLLVTPTAGNVTVSLANDIKGLPANSAFSINDNAGTSTTSIGTGTTAGNITIGTASIPITAISGTTLNATGVTTSVAGSTTLNLTGATLNINRVSGNNTTNINTNAGDTGAVNIGSGGNTGQDITIQAGTGGGSVVINESIAVGSTATTFIGTGTTTGTVTIGGDSAAKTQSVVVRGGRNSASAVNINAGALTTEASGAVTNIGTGEFNTGTVTIGGATAGKVQSVIIQGGSTNNANSRVDINASSGAATTNIGTGTTTGAISVGSTSGNQTITIRSGATGEVRINSETSGGTATVIGTGTTTGSVTIGGGDTTAKLQSVFIRGGRDTASVVNINAEALTAEASGAATNIGTGQFNTGTVTIGGAAAAKIQSVVIRAGQTSSSVGINVDAVGATTNIGTGTTTGLVTIGGDSAAKVQSVVVRGGRDTASVVNINAEALTAEASGAATNIGTGQFNTGTVTIGGAAAAKIQSVVIRAGQTSSSVGINVDAVGATTNIGTGTTTGAIGIGSASGNQTITIRSGATGELRINSDTGGATTTVIGTGTTTGAITIGSAAPTSTQAVTIQSGASAGVLNINAGAGTATTNIGTGTTTGTVNIGQAGDNSQNITILSGRNTTTPGIISINHDAAGPSATRIGTGTTTGAIAIGGSSNTVTIGGTTTTINSTTLTLGGTGRTVTLLSGGSVSGFMSSIASAGGDRSLVVTGTGAATIKGLSAGNGIALSTDTNFVSISAGSTVVGAPYNINATGSGDTNIGNNTPTTVNINGNVNINSAGDQARTINIGNFHTIGTGRINIGTDLGANITHIRSRTTLIGSNNHLSTGDGEYRFIGGGESNRISGTFSAGTHHTIVGGQSNQINTAAIASANSIICGGSGNIITSSSRATIVGGIGNTITANSNDSFVAGTNASAAHAGCFVWSDNSTTTPKYESTATNQVSFKASGGFRIHTNTAATLGPQVVTGSEVWSTLSDRTKKDLESETDSLQILAGVETLPLYYWTYKDAVDKSRKNIGPTVQDWQERFPLGRTDLRIDTLEFDGVALSAIKGVAQLVRTLETRADAADARASAAETRADAADARAAATEAEVAGLRAENAALAARLAAIEARFANM